MSYHGYPSHDQNRPPMQPGGQMTQQQMLGQMPPTHQVNGYPTPPQMTHPGNPPTQFPGSFPGQTPPTQPRPPMMGMGPPTQIGAPPKMMNFPGAPHPPTSMQNRPPNQMGPPTQMRLGPPTQIGAPPTQMNGPPTQLGAPPTQIGAPPTQMGAPPTQMGAPPIRPPQMGAPPTQMRPPQMTGMPGGSMPPPTQMGHQPRPPPMSAPPTSMGPPPTQMGQQTNHMPGQMPPQQTPGAYQNGYSQGQMGSNNMGHMTNNFGNMNLNSGESNQSKPVDLMNGKEHLIGPAKYEPKPIKYQTMAPPGISRIPPNRKNCDREVMACTMNAIPSSESICQKSKLPFGLILHPYKDLQTLPVITTSNIVRCRSCRSYINPFVSFIDVSRWKCNLCGRVNEVPEEFKSNPINKDYGKPEERPECQNSTVEFIAPAEYMSRPPQAAQYLFILDVSYNALKSGYLDIFAEELLSEYKSLPGDRRTSIGFICYDSSIHFFNLSAENPVPVQMTVSDIDDPFEPYPEGLIVNREECQQQIEDFLKQLPTIFSNSTSSESCAGSALTIGKKLITKNGGRISLFSTTRINCGLGKLEERKSSKPDSNEMLNAKTDYYKTLAIDANQQHVAIDLFLMGHQFQDVASIAPAARNSAGTCYRYPGLHSISNELECKRLRNDLYRYFTRKIGFEAVMRVRATRGISIHTFYGNFFVRSTDLLNLACVSPDSGYAMRLHLDDDLKGVDYVGFQCALLYTSPKGDRRIRVHTMSLPVTSSVQEIHNNADAELVAGMLAHMAADRSMSHSLNDAREALSHAVSDAVKSYSESLPSYLRPTNNSMIMPPNMKQFPLLISALLKSEAFRTQQTLDDSRSFTLQDIRQQPCRYSKHHYYPDLYRVDNILEYPKEKRGDHIMPCVTLLPLSCQYISKDAIFILDVGWALLLYITVHSPKWFLNDVLGIESFGELKDASVFEFPDSDSDEEDENSKEPESKTLFKNFIYTLTEDRPHAAPLQIIRDDGQSKPKFISKMIQDRTQQQMSYYEFLTHLQKNLK